MQSNRSPFRPNRPSQTGSDLQQVYFSLFRSAGLIHWVGYGLLLFVGLDLAAIFYPSYFTDPSWLLQTMGELVERVPVPLLGLLLVFFSEHKPRLNWEFLVLRILSWLTLLASLVFLLLIPLGIVSTVQLDVLVQQQVNADIDRQLVQVQQVEARVQQATSGTQLAALARRYNIQELDLEPLETGAVEASTLQQDFVDALDQRQRVIEGQRQTQIVRQRNRLLKQSVKWSIGAGIAALILLGFWKGTQWAR